MLDDLRGLLKQVGRDADAQQQREAMIDLLIWTMYADNLLALSENDRIDQMAGELKWDSATPPGQYLNVSIAKIRDAIDDDETASRVMDSIYERLGTDEMRRKAYSSCRELANVDGEMAEEEMEFLNTVKHRFGVDESD